MQRLVRNCSALRAARAASCGRAVAATTSKVVLASTRVSVQSRSLSQSRTSSYVEAKRVLPRTSSAGFSRPAVRTPEYLRRTSQRQLATSAESKQVHLPPMDTFVHRHIGPTKDDTEEMLKVIGEPSLDALIDKVVPKAVRAARPLSVGSARGEAELLAELKQIMSKNEVFRSHIGAGYYNTLTPNVILRNMIENPGWYTPYTPYSAEIAQGRMEMLLNFQTMVTDLTGMSTANASLLDEATAAAEAMTLCMNSSKNKKNFLVSDACHEQTIAVLKTRASGIGCEVVVQPVSEFDYSEACGVLVQYPDTTGHARALDDVVEKAHAHGALVCAATDLLALTQLKAPGEFGVDIALGSAQRFGVPMGYGGPHAAFFATHEKHKRKIPGRLIGLSIDAQGNTALRMAMQTREQHIRRERATSNICTAQALLANVAGAYAVFHGPTGLKRIGRKVHHGARLLHAGLVRLGFDMGSNCFFDTVHVILPQGDAEFYNQIAQKKRINLRVRNEKNITISLDETVKDSHVMDLLTVFAQGKGKDLNFGLDDIELGADEFDALARTTPFMEHPIFNMYHSETEMMRYLFKLQMRDLSLQTAMIPLGSCTMKLNAAAEMIPVTWPEVNGIHPFAPPKQVKGYLELIENLEQDLANITGFHSVSMQPNSGAQGEYAGLMCIQAFHNANGNGHRNVCLIPASAHGTNPASAKMAGLKIVGVKCTDDGRIDMEDFTEKLEKHKDNLSSMMVTYPSTYGVFEDNIKDVIAMVHERGGQVYMDGANMNAQVGLCSPGEIGADVCHLNLHKTFCIPHGGGGPGAGPIGVAEHLAPFLMDHPLVQTGGDQACGTISAAPFGSSSILPISWMYIKLMGSKGLTHATKMAILNANYMKARLEKHYPVTFVGTNGYVGHEFIMDISPFKATADVVPEDVAKRLMDYNFHAPTMSWPVSTSLMVEPTESESKAEMDRFCDALIEIRQEISEIEEGKTPKNNNLLKNSPHTAQVIGGDKWDVPYSRKRAAFPHKYLEFNKFWPSKSRIDNVYGDRNLVCSCPPMEDFM